MPTKMCRTCLKLLDRESNFSPRSDSRRVSSCKACCAARVARSLAPRRQERNEYVNAHRAKLKAQPSGGWALIQTAKAQPCKDCGGTFPEECMDFDHLDGRAKAFAVSSMLQCAVAKVEEEIAKCDVICSNYHRIRTKKRRSGVSI